MHNAEGKMKDETPDLKRLLTVFAGMPCTNRETAADKAAAHAWMEKERARRPTKARAKFLQAVERMLEERRAAKRKRKR